MQYIFVVRNIHVLESGRRVRSANGTHEHTMHNYILSVSQDSCRFPITELFYTVGDSAKGYIDFLFIDL